MKNWKLAAARLLTSVIVGSFSGCALGGDDKGEAQVGTDSTDNGDATDATDGSDTTDSTDATDGTDGNDATDTTDATDGSEGFTPCDSQNLCPAGWVCNPQSICVEDVENGEDGGKGPKGDTGEQGEPGDKGDTGDTGAQGPQGDTVINGAVAATFKQCAFGGTVFFSGVDNNPKNGKLDAQEIDPGSTTVICYAPPAAPTECVSDAGCPTDVFCDGTTPMFRLYACIAGTCVAEDPKVAGIDCYYGCSEGVCVQEPDCDDGDACTADSYNPAMGGCQFAQKTCNDSDPATTDSCNPATGSCVFTPNPECDVDKDCEVPDVCNGNSLVGFVYECQAHQCVQLGSAGVVCPYGCYAGECNAEPSCNDGVACTVDTYYPGQGCTHVPNHGACDDGDVCSTDTCVAATGCVSTAKACDDGDSGTADSCNGQTGLCEHTTIPPVNLGGTFFAEWSIPRSLLPSVAEISQLLAGCKNSAGSTILEFDEYNPQISQAIPTSGTTVTMTYSKLFSAGQLPPATATKPRLRCKVNGKLLRSINGQYNIMTWLTGFNTSSTDWLVLGGVTMKLVLTDGTTITMPVEVDYNELANGTNWWGQTN